MTNEPAAGAEPVEGMPSSASKRNVLLRQIFAAVAFCVILSEGIYLMVGAWGTRALLQPISGGIETGGRVVLVVQHHYKSTTYAPVIEFSDQAGNAHLFQAPSSSTEVLVGSSATVSYDPRNPAHAHDLSDSSTSWHWPFFTGVFVTAIAVLMGVGVGVVIIRQRRRTHAGILPERPTAVSIARNRKIFILAQIVTLPIIAIPVYFIASGDNKHSMIGIVAAASYLVIAVGYSALISRILMRRAQSAMPPESGV